MCRKIIKIIHEMWLFTHFLKILADEEPTPSMVHSHYYTDLTIRKLLFIFKQNLYLFQVLVSVIMENICWLVPFVYPNMPIMVLLHFQSESPKFLQPIFISLIINFPCHLHFSPLSPFKPVNVLLEMPR